MPHFFIFLFRSPLNNQEHFSSLIMNCFLMFCLILLYYKKYFQINVKILKTCISLGPFRIILFAAMSILFLSTPTLKIQNVHLLFVDDVTWIHPWCYLTIKAPFYAHNPIKLRQQSPYTTKIIMSMDLVIQNMTLGSEIIVSALKRNN